MPKKPRYTVNVGNVGIVLDTDSAAHAAGCARHYEEQILAGHAGRAEFPVVVFEDEKIIIEYTGKTEYEDACPHCQRSHGARAGCASD